VTKTLGPAFHKATGYTINGLPGGSGALANEIKTGAQKADVFISAAPASDLALEGSKNGNWVRWYLPLGRTPLLIGYNKHSSFAHLFRSEPWWKVLESKGFRLGRTDPVLDPKGALTVELLKKEAQKLHDTSLVRRVLGSTENPSQVFPEETLVSRLQAGQLDAGFFFGIEARVASLPTVSTGITLYGDYTVSIVKGAQNLQAADALVRFLYSQSGRKILSASGVEPTAPKVFGSAKAFPKDLRSILGHSKK
jgi:molybdate/tungstate transport system substrate-binding protein